jgi:hypothetical protein
MTSACARSQYQDSALEAAKGAVPPRVFSGQIEGGGVYAHGANVTGPRHTRRSGGAPVAATNDEHVGETPETRRVRVRVLTAEQRRALVDDINARMAQLKQQWERSGHSFIPSFFEIEELAGA